ncbi:MAG: hypothetical protein WC755_03975 [Candidatus Woesearchaeota archaeon]|jgi:hypothetical protein
MGKMLHETHDSTEHKHIIMPAGIILLIVVMAFEIFTKLYNYSIGSILFFGSNISGRIFTFVNTILLICSVVVLIGIAIKSYRFAKFAFWYYLFIIVNYVFVALNAFKLAPIVLSKASLIITMHVGGIILFAMMMFYLIEKKTLFLHKKDDNKSIDSLFVTAYVVCFVVLMILSFVV